MTGERGPLAAGEARDGRGRLRLGARVVGGAALEDVDQLVGEETASLRGLGVEARTAEADVVADRERAGAGLRRGASRSRRRRARGPSRGRGRAPSPSPRAPASGRGRPASAIDGGDRRRPRRPVRRGAAGCGTAARRGCAAPASRSPVAGRTAWVSCLTGRPPHRRRATSRRDPAGDGVRHDGPRVRARRAGRPASARSSAAGRASARRRASMAEPPRPRRRVPTWTRSSRGAVTTVPTRSVAASAGPACAAPRPSSASIIARVDRVPAAAARNAEPSATLRIAPPVSGRPASALPVERLDRRGRAGRPSATAAAARPRTASGSRRRTGTGAGRPGRSPAAGWW